MSSVSMSGGCSAALFSSLQQSRAADSSKSQQLFSKLDVNGDDSIDASELKSFVDYVGEQTGTAAVDSSSLLTSLDSDGDGSISATELTDNASKLFDQLRDQLMSSQLQSRPDPTEMFDSIDSDGDGSISKTELDSFLSDRADATGTAPDAAEILARDDTDGDGSISADEFKTAMQHGPGGPGGPGGAGGPPPPPPSSSSSDDDALSSLLALLQQYGSLGTSDSASTSTLSVAA